MVTPPTLSVFLKSAVIPNVGSILFSFWSPPFGPAGDRIVKESYLEWATSSSPTQIHTYLVPCIRNEPKKKIRSGTHLSLFFLLITIFWGNTSNKCMIDTLESLLENHVSDDTKGNTFIVYPGGFSPAKEFPFRGKGFHLALKTGLDLVHAAEISFEKGDCIHKCIGYIFALSIERLLLYKLGKNDIWKTKPFLNEQPISQE